MSEDQKYLIFAVLRYFEEQLLDSSMGPDAKETLEVASQCLENVYKINSSDAGVKAKYPLPASLPEIFKAGLKIKMDEKNKDVTPEQKAEADQHKSDGNAKMKAEDYDEAVKSYSKAIETDSNNAVYFCNRAAAFSKLNKHTEALADCVSALIIDPNYSKAYGRKGLAHSAINQHKEALQSFEKAVELDPANESYKKNLELAEQKLAEEVSAGGGMPGFPGMGGLGGMPGGGMPGGGMPGGMGGLGGLGGMDFGALLNNPALMNMATQMMSNPGMQEMMANMMGGLSGQAGAGAPEASGDTDAPAVEGAGAGGMPDLSGLLQMGQQMAQQFQQTNPDLVDQLRQQHQSTESSQEDSEMPKDKPDGGNDGSAS